MLARYKDIWTTGTHLEHTSGTSQDWTAHYLQWWHNWTNSFKSMALLGLQTLSKEYLQVPKIITVVGHHPCGHQPPKAKIPTKHINPV